MYRVKLNGKIVEHSLKTGDRVYPKGQPSSTGTVDDVIQNGLFINIQWDDHCKDRLGKEWLPSSLIKM